MFVQGGAVCLICLAVIDSYSAILVNIVLHLLYADACPQSRILHSSNTCMDFMSQY
jgi:hypothetical protein